MKKLLILHHSAVSRIKAPSQFYAINNYHKQKWNMKSCKGYYHGYTHYLGTNGVITQTRCLDEEGMHTIGYNKSGHIAICLAGDFNVELPSDKQIASLRAFIQEHEQYEVKFHRELQKNRTCPGILFTREWLEAILNKEEQEKKEDLQEKINTLNILMEKLSNLLRLLKLWKR